MLDLKYKLNRWKYRLDAAVGETGRKLVRWSQRDSNCVAHAKSEWAFAFPNRDDMQDAIGENVLDVVAMFSLANHSGFSASYATNYIKAALKFEPLSPLTGEDHEWGEPFDYNGAQQNKRCGRVFKGADGRAYDIDGRVFRDPDGSCWTGKDSRVYVTFPYVPKTEIVDIGGDNGQ